MQLPVRGGVEGGDRTVERCRAAASQRSQVFICPLSAQFELL
jgi:hypothetical protein